MIRRLDENGGNCCASGPCEDCLWMREANHRIANQLAMLSAYVQLQIGGIVHGPPVMDKGAVLLLLKGVDSQIQILGRQHRRLSETTATSLPEVGEYLHEILEPFQSDISGLAVVEAFHPHCTVRREQVLRICQILAEVVMNAFKNARSDCKGVVRAGCYRTDGGAVVIEVSDNGPGLPKTFDPKRDGGVGFRLLRALSSELDAAVEFLSDESGLRFRLTLPPDATQSPLVDDKRI